MCEFNKKVCCKYKMYSGVTEYIVKVLNNDNKYIIIYKLLGKKKKINFSQLILHKITKITWDFWVILYQDKIPPPYKYSFTPNETSVLQESFGDFKRFTIVI